MECSLIGSYVNIIEGETIGLNISKPVVSTKNSSNLTATSDLSLAKFVVKPKNYWPGFNFTIKYINDLTSFVSMIKTTSNKYFDSKTQDIDNLKKVEGILSNLIKNFKFTNIPSPLPEEADIVFYKPNFIKSIGDYSGTISLSEKDNRKEFMRKYDSLVNLVEKVSIKNSKKLSNFVSDIYNEYQLYTKSIYLYNLILSQNINQMIIRHDKIVGDFTIISNTFKNVQDSVSSFNYYYINEFEIILKTGYSWIDRLHATYYSYLAILCFGLVVAYYYGMKKYLKLRFFLYFLWIVTMIFTCIATISGCGLMIFSAGLMDTEDVVKFVFSSQNLKSNLFLVKSEYAGNILSQCFQTKDSISVSVSTLVNNPDESSAVASDNSTISSAENYTIINEVYKDMMNHNLISQRSTSSNSSKVETAINMVFSSNTTISNGVELESSLVLGAEILRLLTDYDSKDSLQKYCSKKYEQVWIFNDDCPKEYTLDSTYSNSDGKKCFKMKNWIPKDLADWYAPLSSCELKYDLSQPQVQESLSQNEFNSVNDAISSYYFSLFNSYSTLDSAKKNLLGQLKDLDTSLSKSLNDALSNSNEKFSGLNLLISLISKANGNQLGSEDDDTEEGSSSSTNNSFKFLSCKFLRDDTNALLTILDARLIKSSYKLGICLCIVGIGLYLSSMFQLIVILRYNIKLYDRKYFEDIPYDLLSSKESKEKFNQMIELQQKPEEEQPNKN